MTAFRLALEEDEIVELKKIFEEFAAATSMTFIDWGSVLPTRSGYSINFFIVRSSTDHMRFHAMDLPTKHNFNIFFYGQPNDPNFINLSDQLGIMLQRKWPGRLAKMETTY